MSNADISVESGFSNGFPNSLYAARSRAVFCAQNVFPCLVVRKERPALSHQGRLYSAWNTGE